MSENEGQQREQDGENAEEEGFSEGDRVIFSDTHHMHNDGLKACEGRKGTITAEPGRYNDKYLVEFDGSTRKLSGRYWVAPQWLDPVDEGVDDAE